MFGVDLASIKSLNINCSKLTAEWDITLFVSNPNYDYHRVSYNTVSIGVHYSNKNNQSLLATTLLNPFSQINNHKDNKRVQFNMDVNNDIAMNIADSCSRGAVDFGIVLSTSFKYKGRYDHFRRVRHLKVVCEPLSFITSKGGFVEVVNMVKLREKVENELNMNGKCNMGDGICKVEIIFMCGEMGANKRSSARKGLQLRDANEADNMHLTTIERWRAKFK
ncbi:hypothetical protein MTR_4g011390 [Medicago truncatula]|uniref:Late embryogenesis abundant protein LEA-2 subgroup domain-containing protein n=1 Tax=Medicago truncatula TaxID=3880 RepID=A0A072UH23_MEDTR|nr:hypothetical protein MTR_4g011390 [Medicago truncatula]